MFGAIGRWLLGGGISAIGGQINEWQRIRAEAQNDHERLEADKMIATLEAQRAVLLAEQGNWLTRWIRPAFALPFAIYIWKLVLFDKVLGWGTTDNLSPDLWKLFWIIIGAYFLTRPVEKYLRR